MVGADHPERGGGLHYPATGKEPGTGEIVVGLEAGELVPVVVDGIDVGMVGALEIPLQLQIVRRIGKHQIHGARRQLRHFGDAVAHKDAGSFGRLKMSAGRP